MRAHPQDIEPARELSRYGGDSVPPSELTRVDTLVEQRARAMIDPALASSNPPAPAPMPALPMVSAPPTGHLVGSVGAAMHLRVRVGWGEVPLWSLLTPLVIVTALVAAFAASLVSTNRLEPRAAAGAPSAAASVDGEVPANGVSPSGSSVGEPVRSEARPAVAPGPARSYEAPAGKLSTAEVLAIAEERAVAEVTRARALREALKRDPGLVTNPRTLSEISRLVASPESARIVLGSVAAVPGPISADLLYALWTRTVDRNETTELARTLLYSSDVRPKASAALAVALDLRNAETCEANAAILPRAIEHGDKRALHLIARLQRRYGCGPNKRLDCFACLRGDTRLEEAFKVVRDRRAPRPFDELPP